MNEIPPANEKPKLPTFAHAIAGWPLIMIFFGGALGGLCVGAAYGSSIALFKKRGVRPLTCFLSLLIGLAGIGLYIVAAVALVIAFPNIFGPKH